MSFVPAKCTNCGANIQVDPQKEAGICEACGTPFITEKVINNYNVSIQNTTNINGEKVNVYVGNKNIDALVEKGMDIIKKELILSKEQADVLIKIASDISDIESRNFYAYFFSMVSGFVFDKIDIDLSNFSDMLEVATKEETDLLYEKIFGFLDFETQVLEKVVNEDDNNVMAYLSSSSELSENNVILIFNQFAGYKSLIKEEYSQKFFELERRIISFLEKCFIYVEKQINQIYFTEEKVQDYNLKKIFKQVSLLNFYCEISKTIISDSEKIKESGKVICETIKQNEKIIATNQIYGINLLKEIAKLPGSVYTFSDKSSEVCIIINSQKVILSSDSISIGEGDYSVIIKATDILFISCSVNSDDSYDYIAFDIVYKLQETTITSKRLIYKKDKYDIALDDKIFSAISTWANIRNINIEHNKWFAFVPIVNGLNKYRYQYTDYYAVKIIKGWFTDENEHYVSVSKATDYSFLFQDKCCIFGPYEMPYDKIVVIGLKSNNEYRLRVKVTGKTVPLTIYSSSDCYPILEEVYNKIKIRAEKVQGKKIVENSGGCYIATCVYGSYDCPQVWTLRRYRDYKLAKTWFGRAFIHTYYAISPTLVRWFGKTKWFKKLWQGKLDKMVSKLQKQGFDSTPYEDKKWE